MRSKLLPLLLMLLLASCTITKRRYMSGYSIDWKHKAPKRMASAQPQPVHIARPSTYASRPGQPQDDAPPLHGKEWSHSVYSEQSQNNPKENVSVGAPIETKKLSNTQTAFPQTIPGHGSPNQKEDCPQADRCLTFGILTLLIPAAILLLAYSIGAANAAGGNSLAFLILVPAIFISGIVILVFMILALVAGSAALSKISKDTDKYSGKWKIFVGITLALLPILAILVLILSLLSQR